MVISDIAAKHVNKNTGRNIRKTAQNKKNSKNYKKSICRLFNFPMNAKTF